MSDQGKKLTFYVSINVFKYRGKKNCLQKVTNCFASDGIVHRRFFLPTNFYGNFLSSDKIAIFLNLQINAQKRDQKSDGLKSSVISIFNQDLPQLKISIPCGLRKLRSENCLLSGWPSSWKFIGVSDDGIIE